jgi:hypothetical protein
MDYARILYNHDASGGKSADKLLDHYGVQPAAGSAST